MLEVLLSAVRACLSPLLCIKPVGEARGTEVLATAVSKVSITKDIGTDGADVLVGKSIHKLVIIVTMSWLVTGRKKKNRILHYLFTMLNVPYLIVS